MDALPINTQRATTLPVCSLPSRVVIGWSGAFERWSERVMGTGDFSQIPTATADNRPGMPDAPRFGMSCDCVGSEKGSRPVLSFNPLTRHPQWQGGPRQYGVLAECS